MMDADELNGCSWYFFEPIFGDRDDCNLSVLGIFSSSMVAAMSLLLDKGSMILMLGTSSIESVPAWLLDTSTDYFRSLIFILAWYFFWKAVFETLRVLNIEIRFGSSLSIVLLALKDGSWSELSARLFFYGGSNVGWVTSSCCWCSVSVKFYCWL